MVRRAPFAPSVTGYDFLPFNSRLRYPVTWKVAAGLAMATTIHRCHGRAAALGPFASSTKPGYSTRTLCLSFYNSTHQHHRNFFCFCGLEAYAQAPFGLSVNHICHNPEGARRELLGTSLIVSLQTSIGAKHVAVAALTSARLSLNICTAF